jgi:hypothetical protein
LSDWTTAPNRNRLAAFEIAKVSGHVAGGKDVGEEENLFVAQACWHLYRADIRVWNSKILGLTTSVTAEEMGIPEQPGG